MNTLKKTFETLLITRNIVVLPDETVQIEVGRTESVNAVNIANTLGFKDNNRKIIVACQIKPTQDNPIFSDIYHTATLCEIISSVKSLDEGVLVEVKGLKRIILKNIEKLSYAKKRPEHDTIKIVRGSEWYDAEYEDFVTILPSSTLLPSLKSKVELILSLLKSEINIKTSDIKLNNIEQIIDKIAIAMGKRLLTENRYSILSTKEILKRLDLLLSFAEDPASARVVDQEINKKVNDKMNKSVREHYLREKYHEIRHELGQLDPHENETNAYRKKVEENPYPEYIKKRVLAELSRMEGAHPQENSINRQYVEWLLNIPWWQTTKDDTNIKHVEESLNKSHYGLEKAKERIVEYLSVRLRSPLSKAPIMCLVGPPGVGKTTLAQSIAEAINKKFCKVNLGGISDEAEIRGHRKTYIGAMPGRIIKAMKSAETINPLFLLDEIDKMNVSYHGDPASAMLEVLDPSLNKKFSDNYIEEPYDLSQVMFVATANYAEQIPAPLYDRLEIIEITSYTEYEKFEIAKRHLINRVFEDAKVSHDELKFSDDAIFYIIRRYTRESGVRQLERLIQTIVRKFIVQQQKGGLKNETIGIKEVVKYLKKEIFENNEIDKKPTPGVVNGMAYTSVGGDLLPIEVTTFKGKGNVSITGNLKTTMQESVQVAIGFVKANASAFGVRDIDFSKIDIHVHVPSGGIPKDGPSAGVTITTALISALSARPVSNQIAMTGEITLRGKVGIIGGVKEKIISAVRGGVKEIFIPEPDQRYLEDVPSDVLAKTKIHFVKTYNDIYTKIFKNK